MFVWSYLSFVIIKLVINADHIEALESLLNLNNPIFLHPEDQQQIEFGYSLSLYKNGTHRNLLVGAPRANSRQQDVMSPGALYSCDILEAEKWTIFCSQLNVDTRNSEDKYVPFIDEDLKNFQRLGGSLATMGNDIVVCAPNWHYYEKRVTQTIDAPVGICFRGSTLEKFYPFSPPYDLYKGVPKDYLTTGSCQAGFSSTFTKDHSIILGSPGCYNWEGDVFAESDTEFVSFGKSFTTEDVGGIGETDDLWLWNMYLGYSVTEGEFSRSRAVVVGMPRSDNIQKEVKTIYGNVDVVNPMVTIHLLTNDGITLWTLLSPPRNSQGSFDSAWIFSYFGYSVAVTDVDGDGLDDVIVGAPFYHNETNFDQGAVLVYMQKKEEMENDTEEVFHMILERNTPLRMGEIDYGRFGSCVVNAGDLNGDSVMDVAVGAPHTDGGKVYIYLGDREGLASTPYQILSSSEEGLQGKNLRGFGSSLASSFHMGDGPQSDLAIAAFPSDTIVIFKSKVLIDVKWMVSFPQKFELSSTCPINEKLFPCTEIKTCFSYSFLQNGKKGDTRPKEFTLTHSLDVNSSPKRLFFDDYTTSRSTSVFVEFEKLTCSYDKVYTNRKMYNLDSFNIFSSIAHVVNRIGDQSALQTKQMLSQTTVLDIRFDCEAANASGCISDLHLQVDAYPSIVKAETVHFNLLYQITNFGEPSYSNMLELSMDPFLEISGKAEISDNSTVFPTIDCTTLEKGNSRCSLGTFIKTDALLMFSLSIVSTEDFLNIENLSRHKPFFEVRSSLLTVSDIKYPDAAKKLNVVNMETKPQVFLSKNGSSTDLISFDKDIQYRSPEEAEKDSQVGPSLTHIYEIYNKMNYVIENNKLRIYWPYKINEAILLDGKVTLSTPTENCKTNLQKGYVKDANKNLSTFGDVIWKVTSCNVHYLEPLAYIHVKLQLQFVFNTLLQEVYNPDFNEIPSYAYLECNPVLLTLKSKIVMTNNINTRISYGDFVFRHVPIWVYILGAVLGVALLILLIFCLRTLNFFKRNKKQKFSEENLAEEEEEEEEEEPQKIEERKTSNMEEETGDQEEYDNI